MNFITVTAVEDDNKFEVVGLNLDTVRVFESISGKSGIHEGTHSAIWFNETERIHVAETFMELVERIRAVEPGSFPDVVEENGGGKK